LGLFKGELSLNDILWGLPKKRLFELRDARVEQLKAEQEANDEAMKSMEQESIRNRILAP
jgi:hypothetical protein